jgi:dipeptidyl aminopeptidase/acylaminoacyl peptidase
MARGRALRRRRRVLQAAPAVLLAACVVAFVFAPSEPTRRVKTLPARNPTTSLPTPGPQLGGGSAATTTTRPQGVPKRAGQAQGPGAPGASHPQSASPLSEFRVAFERDTAGSTDILTMRGDGTAIVGVAADPAVSDSDPSWSPDGQQLVFTSDRDHSTTNAVLAPMTDIYMMNADGSQVRRLTTASPGNGNGNSDARFSPDGQRIVFGSDLTNGASEIFTMRRDGTDQQNLTNDSADEDFAPAWSPDGATIVFARTKSADRVSHVWIMRADGSGQRQLTFGDTSDQNPVFSPAGDRLAFKRFDASGVGHVHVISVDGTNGRRVTAESAPAETYGASWLPDGTGLMIGFDRDGTGTGARSEVRAVRFGDDQPTSIRDCPAGAFDTHFTVTRTG